MNSLQKTKQLFSHCVSLWGSVTTNCGVESNWWCVQIILVTHNYLLISTTSKWVPTAINCTLWPFSYNTHHLIVCEMKTIDISFHEESTGEGPQALTCSRMWADHLALLIFIYADWHVWKMVPFSFQQTLKSPPILIKEVENSWIFIWVIIPCEARQVKSSHF